MADRKKTPDLLASVLNEPVLLGDNEVKAQGKLEEAKAKPQKKSRPKPKQPIVPPQKAAPPVPAPPVWEYKEVTFREYDGWRARLVNGVELRGWKSQPVLHDYLAQMGMAGWELVSMGERHRNQKEAYFKRQVSKEMQLS